MGPHDRCLLRGVKRLKIEAKEPSPPEPSPNHPGGPPPEESSPEAAQPPRTARSPEEESARERRRARQRRGPLAHVASWLIRGAFVPFRLVPPALALFFARRLGDFFWWILPSRRKIANENLLRAFGDLYSPKERARIGRESVQRFAMTIVEGTLLPGWIRSGHLAEIVREGPGVAEAFERHRRGEPIIFFAGHIGPWEVIVRHFKRRGWRIGVPYRSTKNEVLQDWIVRTRAIEGPEQFPRRGALRPMVRLLRDGAAVTMFLDQNERNGIFVDFFGHPAGTVPTVGVLAERCQGAVYFQRLRRLTPGKQYTVDFEGPLTIAPGGTPDERIHAWTRAATARIEGAIREKPSDWLWIHRRWRTRPPVSDAGA